MADQTDTTKTRSATPQEALNSLAAVVRDAAELTVTTYVFELDSGGTTPDTAKKVAHTALSWDGDADVFVPVKNSGGSMTVHTELFQLHQQSVDKATQARIEILNAVKGLLIELKGVIE